MDASIPELALCNEVTVNLFGLNPGKPLDPLIELDCALVVFLLAFSSWLLDLFDAQVLVVDITWWRSVVALFEPVLWLFLHLSLLSSAYWLWSYFVKGWQLSWPVSVFWLGFVVVFDLFSLFLLSLQTLFVDFSLWLFMCTLNLSSLLFPQFLDVHLSKFPHLLDLFHLRLTIFLVLPLNWEFFAIFVNLL